MVLALSTSSKVESIFQLLNVLVIFIVVLVITYIATRWLAKMQKVRATNTNIEVIETFKVTNNKYIQILRTGKVYLVIAICKDTITMLTQIDESQLEEVKVIEKENDSFADILEKVKNMKLKK